MINKLEELVASGEIELIPCEEILIEELEDKQIAYDLTVDDYSTFTTDTGIFVFDTMAIYAPVSEEAQEEARTKLVSSVAMSTINDPAFKLTKEMLTGIFTLTYENNGNPPKIINNFEDLKKLHIAQPVVYNFRGKKLTTTVGKLLFNNELPEYIGFVDYTCGAKELQKLMSKIINKSKEDYVHTIDRLSTLGFTYSTMYPRSFSLDMMVLPDNLLKLKDDLAKEKDLANQQDIINKMTSEMMIFLEKEHPDLYEQVKSGAAKDVQQIRQVLVAKGLISDPDGNILPPISKAMNDGYTPEEYFQAAAGSRGGIIDRSHNTAHGGYAYRKMVYVMANCECDINNGNCGTKRTLNLKLTEDLFKRMSGRYVQDEKGQISPVTESMIGKIINLRSPVFCKSEKICRTCYGDLISQLDSKHIGIISAMNCCSLSESIMKSFHMGGAVKLYRAKILDDMLIENVDNSYKPVIEKLCHQDGNELFTDAEYTMINIQKKYYSDKYEIEREGNDIILKVGYFDLTMDDINLPMTIEQPTKIYASEQIEETDDHIAITYSKGDKLFFLSPRVLKPAEIARKVDEYVGGKSPWTTPESLFTKFYKLLGSIENWDTVHMEVIISNILRSEQDPQIPARLKDPYSPVTYSIKSLPGLMSWPMGIAFENMSAALSMGLTSDRAPETSIEKVIFGEPLSDLAKEQILNK